MLTGTTVAATSRAAVRATPAPFPPAFARAASDIGRRPRMEDAFVLELGPAALVAAVLDGVGGYAGGDLAASVAAGALATAYRGGARAEELGLAFASANLAVRDVSRRPGLGMASAAAAAIAIGPEGGVTGLKSAVVGWSGDCRVYRLRGDKLRQLTTDHGPTEAEVRAHLAEVKAACVEAKMSAAERVAYLAIAEAGARGTIAKCLGMGDQLDAEFRRVDVRAGDVFLVCTDGLVNHMTGRLKLPEAAVKRALRTAEDPARALVNAVLGLGEARQDNAACVVVRV